MENPRRHLLKICVALKNFAEMAKTISGSKNLNHPLIQHLHRTNALNCSEYFNLHNKMMQAVDEKMKTTKVREWEAGIKSQEIPEQPSSSTHTPPVRDDGVKASEASEDYKEKENHDNSTTSDRRDKLIADVDRKGESSLFTFFLNHLPVSQEAKKAAGVSGTPGESSSTASMAAAVASSSHPELSVNPSSSSSSKAFRKRHRASPTGSKKRSKPSRPSRSTPSPSPSSSPSPSPKYGHFDANGSSKSKNQIKSERVQMKARSPLSQRATADEEEEISAKKEKGDGASAFSNLASLAEASAGLLCEVPCPFGCGKNLTAPGKGAIVHNCSMDSSLTMPCPFCGARLSVVREKVSVCGRNVSLDMHSVWKHLSTEKCRRHRDGKEPERQKLFDVIEWYHKKAKGLTPPCEDSENENRHIYKRKHRHKQPSKEEKAREKGKEEDEEARGDGDRRSEEKATVIDVRTTVQTCLLNLLSDKLNSLRKIFSLVRVRGFGGDEAFVHMDLECHIKESLMSLAENMAIVRKVLDKSLSRDSIGYEVVGIRRAPAVSAPSASSQIAYPPNSLSSKALSRSSSPIDANGIQYNLKPISSSTFSSRRSSLQPRNESQNPTAATYYANRDGNMNESHDLIIRHLQGKSKFANNEAGRDAVNLTSPAILDAAETQGTIGSNTENVETASHRNGGRVRNMDIRIGANSKNHNHGSESHLFRGMETEMNSHGIVHANAGQQPPHSNGYGGSISSQQWGRPNAQIQTKAKVSLQHEPQTSQAFQEAFVSQPHSLEGQRTQTLQNQQVNGSQSWSSPHARGGWRSENPRAKFGAGPSGRLQGVDAASYHSVQARNSGSMSGSVSSSMDNNGTSVIVNSQSGKPTLPLAPGAMDLLGSHQRGQSSASMASGASGNFENGQVENGHGHMLRQQLKQYTAERTPQQMPHHGRTNGQASASLGVIVAAPAPPPATRTHFYLSKPQQTASGVGKSGRPRLRKPTKGSTLLSRVAPCGHSNNFGRRTCKVCSRAIPLSTSASAVQKREYRKRKKLQKQAILERRV